MYSSSSSGQGSGIGAADLLEIMSYVKGHHYHVACTRVFELTHGHVGVKKSDGIGNGESVTHPNQYAARSRELEKGKDGIKSEADANEDVVMG